MQKTHNGQTTDYLYNHEERLTEVKIDGSTVGQYSYNPYGQRIRKTAGGQTTWFLYNDEGLAAEYDGQGNLIKEYHFKPYRPWMTEPLFQRTADGKVYYYQNDHLGTPQRMVDKNGAVVWEARYEAFGRAEVLVSTVENNLRFSGQYFDEETGLHYNYYRDYDPSLGRYVQSDPIGLQGGLNTYAYVDGNPVNKMDPMGLVKWEGSVTTIAAIYGGGAIRFEYKLVSECVDGYRLRVTVIAGGSAVGAGSQFAGTTGGAEFSDNNSTPSWNVFDGTSYYVGAGYAFIGIGYQASAVRLGDAVSYSNGHQMGWDASAYAGAGTTTVTDVKKEQCNCE